MSFTYGLCYRQGVFIRHIAYVNRIFCVFLIRYRQGYVGVSFRRYDSERVTVRFFAQHERFRKNKISVDERIIFRRKSRAFLHYFQYPGSLVNGRFSDVGKVDIYIFEVGLVRVRNFDFASVFGFISHYVGCGEFHFVRTVFYIPVRAGSYPLLHSYVQFRTERIDRPDRLFKRGCVLRVGISYFRAGFGEHR